MKLWRIVEKLVAASYLNATAHASKREKPPPLVAEAGGMSVSPRAVDQRTASPTEALQLIDLMHKF